MEDPPRIGSRRDLRASFQRSYQHVDRRQQEEDREQDQEKIRPPQRPAAIPAHAAVTRFAAGSCRGHRNRDVGHYTSLPRRVMSRRMKMAAIARIGTMNKDTLAPKGMSPPSIPTRNDQVANTCVMSIGPPAVRMRTMSKLAK